jgi:tetratricopeptide (TPR) repeat protein
VSRDRRQTPPFQQPHFGSIQVNYGQGDARPQFAGHDPASSPAGDDAEAWYQRAKALQESARFDEALTAFERAIALRPDYAEAHNGRGIALANLQRSGEAMTSFDKAIALKPDYAEAHNNSGLVLQDHKRFEEALARFDKAIALKPDDTRIHKNRGAVLQDLKQPEEALESYDRALALRPDYTDVLNNRGVVLNELTRLDEAMDSFGKAIALRPDYAEAYSNRGVVLQDLNRFDAALADFDKALALRPDFAEASVNKGYCLLKTGRFEQGLRLHEWRHKAEKRIDHRIFTRPLWLGGEDISNATVFLNWEQGLGDTIQFCRYAKLLKQRGANVVMSVQEPLLPLLRQMSPEISVIRSAEVPNAYDYYCPLMSLPLAFGTTVQTIPCERRYIVSDEALRKAWDARLPPPTKKRIGIFWRGNAAQRNNHNRMIELASLVPLFGDGAHWISLQKELLPRDSATLAELPQIVCLGHEFRDFADTAAVIDTLDLVITVDTGVAHLAGALGKPVWILLGFNADWRWLTTRDDSPWYPTARLFRQIGSGSWSDVVGRVQKALSDFLRSPS